jgi:hypothetical protein
MPGDVLQLQRAVGNQAVSPLLAGTGSSPGSRAVQRWPAITSGTGTYNYTLGVEFRNKHVAADRPAAIAKARRYYDPEDPHRTAVTVIVLSSLTQVTDASEVAAKDGYHWSLRIDDVEAVMMGPSGRVGASGDPGQLDADVTSVVVSGYNTTNQLGQVTGGRITHVQASS